MTNPSKVTNRRRTMKTVQLTDEEIQSVLDAINAFRSEHELPTDPPDEALDSAQAKLIAARDKKL